MSITTDAPVKPEAKDHPTRPQIQYVTDGRFRATTFAGATTTDDRELSLDMAKDLRELREEHLRYTLTMVNALEQNVMISDHQIDGDLAVKVMEPMTMDCYGITVKFWLELEIFTSLTHVKTIRQRLQNNVLIGTPFQIAQIVFDEHKRTRATSQ